MTALNRKLLRELWHIRGQALAIAAVIGGGIATLVMALSAIDSLEETQRAYYEKYRFADVFAHAKRAPRRIERDIAALPGVIGAEARIVHEIIIDVAGMREPARGRVISREANGQNRLNDVVIRRGRDLRPDHPDEVLINEAFAEANRLAVGDVISGNINERRRALRIVGIALSPEFVYVIGPGEVVPDDNHFGVVWMSRNALEAAYDLDGAFNDISLRLARGTSEEAVISAVDRLLERYGGTGAFGRVDHVSHSFITSELEQQEHLAVVIPPVFLAVAAFLINVVAARIVDAERAQIGVLKAFGYRNAQVGWVYLKLILAITCIGVLLGWAAGAWMGVSITRLYAGFFRFPFLDFVVDPMTFIVSAVVGLAAATAGTLAVVRRAAGIAPAVAMAPPAPSVYRAGMIERLGIANRVSPAARMIFRHILRWPLRATLTVAGIAFSVAMLIMSLFFFDAMNEMMDIHFFETERQDVGLAFTEIRGGNVHAALAGLPGVLAVETYRAVPARLRLAQREERVQIMGMAPGARLSLLVDVNRHVVELPPEGIVLSDKLARELAAREGDFLTVSALEGRRPVKRVPITGIVRQYIGLAAYMDRRALNRLMGEGDVVSGASLLTDGAAETALFSTLKETPALLGLTVRQAAFEKFAELIDQHLNTMIFFYLAFAALISVGVVYNSARITLSERARELAALRVLGYTRREVGTILGGELAVLTFVALPLGCVVGYGLSALMVTLFDTRLYRIPFVISDATYGYSVLVVLAAATGSAWIVLRRIATLDLVAVLKTRE